MQRWRGAAFRPLLLAAALVPAAAEAGADFSATPLLSAGRVHDDNVFSSPGDGEVDRITRVSPGIRLGWKADRWSLGSRYEMDVEWFERHPELDQAPARQHAEVGWRRDAGRRLTISLRGAFLETHNPFELNVATGLTSARARARLWSFAPSLSGRLGPRTSAGWDLALDRSDLSGGIETETLTSTLGLDREVTARDRASVSYAYRRFTFEAPQPVDSHAVLFGWARAATPRTRFSLRAGPRLAGGEPPEVEAGLSIEHDLRRGHLSLRYARTQGTAVGEAGALNVESLAAAAAYRLTRSFEVSAAPAVFRVGGAGEEVRVATASLHATWWLRPWLSLRGEVQAGRQTGGLGSAPVAGGEESREIRRTTYALSLAFDPGREPARAPGPAPSGS